MINNIPQDAVDGFLAVRESGLTNMFDSINVWKIMDEFGYTEGCCWLVDFETNRVNRQKYSDLIKEVSEILSVADKL